MSFNPVLDPSNVRLLAMPMNSPLIGSTLCNLAGTIYPVYSTYKALEAKNKPSRDVAEKTEAAKKDSEKDLRDWACYWAIFGCFRSIENVSDLLLFWLPYYYPLKLSILLWLWLPQFDGASYVYRHCLKPLLHKYQPKIEIVLAHLKKHEWIVEAQVPYIKMLLTSLELVRRNAMEWLKWFFSEREETKEIEGEKDPAA